MDSSANIEKLDELNMENDKAMVKQFELDGTHEFQ